MVDEDTSPISEPAPEPAAQQEATSGMTESGTTKDESAEALRPEPQTAQTPADEPLPSESSPTATPTPTPVARPTQTTNFARDLLVKARATIQDRKKIKLEKMVNELEKKGKMTNDEVEKLLHVSDATATRYLSDLEKQGKIKQVGKTGKAVTYTKP